MPIRRVLEGTPGPHGQFLAQMRANQLHAQRKPLARESFRCRNYLLIASGTTMSKTNVKAPALASSRNGQRSRVRQCESTDRFRFQTDSC